MKQVRTVAMIVVLFALMTGGMIPVLKSDPVHAAGPTASSIVGAAEPLNAVGVLQFQQRQQVVLDANGVIKEIVVRVGDSVKQGDLLMNLDATHLDWAVKRAELNLQTAKLSLEAISAKQTGGQSAGALAEANLLAANEQLAQVEAGPSKQQMAAAESRVTAAWVAYTELKQGPSKARLDVLQADLEKTRVNLQQAQRAYDNISWQPDIGTSDQAAALQRATIDFQAAQGAYTETTTVSKAGLASNLSSAQDAQFALDELLKKPTPSDVAIARANVAGAEVALAQAQHSPDIELSLATVQVEQATIDWEEAKLARQQAQVLAPINGMVLAIFMDQGAYGSAGSAVVTLANPKELKMVVDIEQKVIGRVTIGQKVDISVFAVPEHPLKGSVETIAPESTLQAGVTTFPVIIRLEGDAMLVYRAGMTANVTFLGQ